MSSNLNHFENYFKNREEVTEYFKNKTFIFNNIIGDVVYYVSTIPESIEHNYVGYTISFYYELEESLFLHQKFDDFFNLQLAEVRIIENETNEEVVMYFSKYVNPSDN